MSECPRKSCRLKITHFLFIIKLFIIENLHYKLVTLHIYEPHVTMNDSLENGIGQRNFSQFNLYYSKNFSGLFMFTNPGH